MAIVSSIQDYISGRVVALSADSTIYEVARAMEARRVGSAVLVQEGKIVGFVTDRDIVYHGIAHEVPVNAPIKQVMSQDVILADNVETVQDVMEKMIRHGVRRMPVRDRGSDRLAGIVTADDLILAGVVPMEDVSRLIRAQLLQGDELHRRRERKKARLDSKEREFLALLGRHMEVPQETVRKLNVALLNGLMRRVLLGEAAALFTQLPQAIQDAVELPWMGTVDSSITADTLVRNAASQIGLSPEKTRELVPRWWKGLGEFLGAPAGSAGDKGELGNLLAQLPDDLERLLVGGREAA